MDFPVNLRSSWVKGYEELKQYANLLLKNPIGSFLQNYALGAHFSVHGSSQSEIEIGIRQTLEQINGVTVNSVKVEGSVVDVVLEYNGENIKLQQELYE